MQTQLRVAVTGAFGYSGRFIAERLLAGGHEVVTLTNATRRPQPLAGRIRVFPLNFADAAGLAQSLEGVDVLINTYWVRFDHKAFNHAQAVENTRLLFEAARRAGVRRVVHVSITNPSEESPLPYFRGKARLERALRESGLAHTILRPAVLFGHGDILINNIAWALRRFPFFAVFGDGNYRLQPIHVEDFAELAVAEATREGNRVVEAIGPETFSYRELVGRIGEIIGHPRPIVSVPPSVGYWCGRLVGWWQRDEFITREEIVGLMESRLWVEAPPAGSTRLSDWAQAHAGELGRVYASELARRRSAPLAAA